MKFSEMPFFLPSVCNMSFLVWKYGVELFRSTSALYITSLCPKLYAYVKRQHRISFSFSPVFRSLICNNSSSQTISLTCLQFGRSSFHHSPSIHMQNVIKIGGERNYPHLNPLITSHQSDVLKLKPHKCIFH